MDATVSMSAVNSIVSYLEGVHFTSSQARELFLQKIGVTETQLQSADQRLTVKDYKHVWLKALEATGDEAIGLHVGMRHNPNCMSLVSNLFVHSSNIEQGINQYVEYAKLLNTGMDVSIQAMDHEVRLKFHYVEKQFYSLQEIERTLSLLIQRARFYIDHRLKLNYVSLELEKPVYHELYETFFMCPIRYNAPYSEISFSSSYLQHVTEQNNPYVHSALRVQAEKMKQKLVSAKMTERVTALISNHLSSDSFSVETIANKLHMNRQTLYRKLKTENQNFQSLVDNIRRNKALDMLRDSNFSLDDITYFLGFSEPSAFNRAFKRWTGETPGCFQKHWRSQC